MIISLAQLQGFLYIDDIANNICNLVWWQCSFNLNARMVIFMRSRHTYYPIR